MGSIRSNTALAADFPVSPATLQATIDKVDLHVQNGFLSGAGLSQTLAEIGTFMDTYGETAGVPTAAYTGTAGSTTRYYAAVIEYGLAIDNPPRPFPFRNVNSVPGTPLQGRMASASDRVKRYGLKSAAVTVASTPIALTAADYVTLTAPTYSGSVAAGVTFALVAVDASGTPIYAVATNIAPGAQAKDIGATAFGLAPGLLPAHAEYALMPAAAASGIISVGGLPTVAAGGLLSAKVGAVTATYTPGAGDTDASIATSLASAIAGAQPLVTASASGPNITLTAVATGPAGNLSVSLTSSNTSVTLSGPGTLDGGTVGGPVYGPRTRTSGVAGVH